MNIIQFLKNLFGAKPPPRPDNTGVILGHNPAGTDYFVGGPTNPIKHEVRLQDGNWLKYCWSKMLQWCIKNGQYVDFLNCVTNAVITAIETTEYFLTGKKVKYSRKWISKMSGTTKQGNYLYKVADAVRTYGLVLEEDYPANMPCTWDEYYASIPEPLYSSLIKKGQLWLSKWQLQYEFLDVSDPNIDYHLKHAPVVVVIPGHAIAGVYSPDQYMQYRDSYEPWDKKALSNNLQSAMKVILTDKRIVMRRIGWNDLEKGRYVGFDTEERERKFDQAMETLFPDYRVEEKEWNLGKRPWN